MKLKFTNISIEYQSQYRIAFGHTPQKASDYSPVNIYGWEEAYGLEWSWKENLVWIRQTKPYLCNWSPVGAWHEVDWRAVFNESVEPPENFMRVPAQLVDIWERQGVNMAVGESRGDWDYIYDRRELVELKGNRFHKKKNQVNRFQKQNNYEYSSFNDEIIHQALNMQQEWCTWRDCESFESLSAENRVIPRVLGAWKDLESLAGGAIHVGDKLVAYTVGEYVDDGTLLIHFEKGDTGYNGVYQAINQMFLAHAREEASRVNRMQDLGDAGLRKAKLSYRPVDFIKKFNVTLL